MVRQCLAAETLLNLRGGLHDAQLTLRDIGVARQVA